MSEATPASGSADQTFLIGETLYLRGLEAGDATRASAWRHVPFPIPTQRAETILKEEIPAQAERTKITLLACRRSDDAPVGAARIEIEGWRTATVGFHADPALDGAAATKAEMLRLVVPWLSAERRLMVVWADFDGDEAEPLAAAAEIGMRPAYRLREAFWRDGHRRDNVVYERLHPAWVARLGDPGIGIDRAVDPGVVPSSPARARPAGAAIPPAPPNAVMVGERVVLRPLETADADLIARWSRQETDLSFSNGRGMPGQTILARWVEKLGDKDPPGDVEFAIALRDGGDLIGENGLYEIDWVHRTAETGTYLYRPEHRGGGIGTEAKHLLLEYAFERLGLHMVRSFVFSLNGRSAAALRKQGYRDAGHLNWGGIAGLDGNLAGDFAFDLLAEEWRAARQQT